MTKQETERLAVLETKVDNLVDAMKEHREESKKEINWVKNMMWAALVALLGIFVKLVVFS
jgi:hypothetical protein